MKEVLKLALEALEVYWGKAEHRRTKENESKAVEAITAIKEALAQDEKGLFIDLIAQHEGLADELAQPDYRAVKTYHEGKPVYVSQPEQEPVVFIESKADNECADAYADGWNACVHAHKDTTPPKRPWVGLTDEEIAYAYTLEKKFAMQYVDAKLKEKNT